MSSKSKYPIAGPSGNTSPAERFKSFAGYAYDTVHFGPGLDHKLAQILAWHMANTWGKASFGDTITLSLYFCSPTNDNNLSLESCLEERTLPPSTLK